MSKQHMTRLLMAILIGYTFLGIAYSVTVPIFEASDEVWHYPMMHHIANTWTLPIQPLEPGASSGPWRQEASQPPLYYGLGAALTAWIDTKDITQVRHLNPHVAAGEIRPDRSNLNLVVHNPALERFPWRGTTLAIHIARIYSVLLGTWAVYLTWALARELFPTPRWIPLATASVHAFTPMAVFINASINNDNLIIPLCTLALLYMVRLVKGKRLIQRPFSPKVQKSAPLTHPIRAHLGLGVVLGLGLLTKISAIGLLPLVGATVFWEAWQRPKEQTFAQRAAFFVQNLALVLGAAALVSGWWFYRNYRLYNDWLGLNAFYAVLGVRDVAADFGQLWSERFAFVAGYWGNFGGLNVPMPDWIYHLLNGVAILALAGLGVQFGLWLLTPPAYIWRKVWPFQWDDITAARALAWAWPAAVLVSWMRWATITWSSQGRLIFSALPMWSLSLIIGLTSWLRLPLPPLELRSRKKKKGNGKKLAQVIDLSGWLRSPLPPLELRSRKKGKGDGKRLAQVIDPSGWLRSPLPPLELRSRKKGKGDGKRLAQVIDLSGWLRSPLPPLELRGGEGDQGDGGGLALIFASYLAALSIIALPRWIAPAYAPPPPLTVEARAVIPHPLDVTFGGPNGPLHLLGYALDTSAIHAGDSVTLHLYWESRAPTATDHSVFIHLLGEGDRIVAQRDSFPGRGLLSTTWLEPQRAWMETLIIATPPMAYAPDTLSVGVGVYETATGARLQPYGEGIPDTEQDFIRFGQVALTARESTVPNPVNVRFGPAITLVGYDLNTVTLDTDDALTVRLYWQGDAPIETDYTMSIQLIDAQWRKATQSDAWPQNGLAPTSGWDVGEHIIDQRVLPIAPDAPHPNVYDLRVAVYALDENGEIQHLPVVWEEGQMPSQAVVLTRVRVR